MSRYDLATLTSPEIAALLADARPLVILQPLGSVEPHGPHLPLYTDAIISVSACERAAEGLEENGILARIAPAIPYGVTDCAEGFAGAVSVASEALVGFLCAVIAGFYRAGADHVCLVNNHLEPAQDQAVRSAAAEAGASVACPLSRRWAATLSDEFKSGACHAGRYETSIVMAAAPAAVRDALRRALPEVPISLSEKLRAGVTTFAAMGLEEAYAGAPAAATAAEGREQLERLAEMIACEVTSALTGRDGVLG